MREDFTCIVLCSGLLEHPGPAVAAARAGCVGILGYEFVPHVRRTQLQQEIDQFLSLAGPEKHVGVRFSAEQNTLFCPFLRKFSSRRLWIVVSQWSPESLQELQNALAGQSEHRLLAEITDVSDVAKLTSCEIPVDGLIVKGNESGGWVGDSPAFILLQKVLSETRLDVYVQGGIGLNTAAACRLAGARGVVLDDQVLLMSESPLPVNWRTSPCRAKTASGSGCATTARIGNLLRPSRSRNFVKFL